MYSDSSVGVEHHTELGTHGSWGEVLCELSLDEAWVTVGRNDFAPHCFEVGTSLFVLSSVDVSNTLSEVESSGSAIVSALNLEDSLVLLLGALSTLEVSKDCSLVQSAFVVTIGFKLTLRADRLLAFDSSRLPLPSLCYVIMIICHHQYNTTFLISSPIQLINKFNQINYYGARSWCYYISRTRVCNWPPLRRKSFNW